MGIVRRQPAPRSASRPPTRNHRLLLLLVLVVYCFTLASATPSPGAEDDNDKNDDDDDSKPTPTEAPIFLPHYKAESWDLVRGSIITSNTTADETTYTIFCPDETPPACDLSLEFPFIIVGGPDTVRFHGTVTSSYTANVECDLDGTTAATCSGYSSFKRDSSETYHTGSTEQSWTSTLAGADVEWGTLKLADKPSKTDSPLDVTVTTGQPDSTDSDGDDDDDMLYTPQPTDAGSDLGGQRDLRWVLSALVIGVVITECIS